MDSKENIIYKKIELSKILNNKFMQAIIAILFGASVACLNLILIEQEFASQYLYVLLPVVSFIITEIAIIKFNFLKNIFKDVKKTILAISIICGVFTTINIAQNMIYKVYIKQIKIATIFAIPSVIVFLYWFYNKLVYYFKKYIKSLDKLERGYIITIGTILIVSILTIYNTTDVFYNITTPEDSYNYKIWYQQETPENKQKAHEFIKYLYSTNQYDTVYTSDTAPLVEEDVYTNVATDQNDLRQPLFGVFSIPFHIIPRIVANIFKNIRNLYAILIAIIQGMLILISNTLLARMMNLKGTTKLLFLLTLTFTWPSLLFTFNLEQYAMPIFYLITYIYMSINQIKDKDIAYITATGSMLTSGILFPLLGEKNNLKQTVKNIFITFLKCMFIIIVSARIILIFPKGLDRQLGRINQFSSSEYTIKDKVNMYTNFLKNTFIFSEFEVQERIAAAKTLKLQEGNYVTVQIEMPCIRQVDTTKTSIIGILVFLTAVLGFVLNRKDSFTQIAFIWSMFSLVLLFVLGWGTNENGLILYTFYFSWAFICLIYKMFEKTLYKYKKTKNIILTTLLVPIVIINIYGIDQIIQFGIQFFKC